MENSNVNDTALIAFGCAVFGLFIIISAICHLAERSKDIKYIKMEMHRAYNDNEYSYWRRELHTAYWCLIPGVNPDIVESLRRFFRRGENSQQNKSDSIFALLLPSLLGIFICAVCLMGSTFAWFTASQSTATQTIAAANYEIKTDVIGVEESKTKTVAATNGIYNLASGKYSVKLTASGDATTGYCILDFGGTKVYTNQIAKESAVDLTLNINQPVKLKITAVWGTYSGTAEAVNEYTYGIAAVAEDEPAAEGNNNPDVTESAEDNSVYTVKSGDTLSEISSEYNTTVGKLKAYNNLKSNTIQVGWKLKIPPADYEIPNEESTSTAVQVNEQMPTESNTASAEQTSSITELDSMSSNVSN